MTTGSAPAWPRGLVALLAVAALLRLALLPVNAGEYTDGVLLLTQFERPTGIWPPLYTALCWLPAKVIGPLWAGRVVSVIASILAVIPIWRMAERYHGARAALLAGVFAAVAPVALRWAPRVMSDATFALFFWWSCERLLAAWEEPDRGPASRAFAHACIVAGLAALTRYQGMMLVVPALLVGVQMLRCSRIAPAALAGLAAFLLAPLWMAYAGTIHGEQFADRSGGGFARTLSVLVSNAEPFLLFTPYYLGYPVAALALVGLIRPAATRQGPLLLLTTYTGVVLLVAQSLFSSFQERYFLPLHGLLWVFAGAGADLVRAALERRSHRLAAAPAAIAVAWSLLLAAAAIWGSHDAWGDVARASRRATADSFKGTLWTNETYREGITGDKVRFFAHRGTDVRHLGEDVLRGAVRLKPGDRILLLDIQQGEQFADALSKAYRLEHLFTETATVVPVFADLMSGYPGSQNPLAWHSRYTMQAFSTSVYEVR